MFNTQFRAGQAHGEGEAQADRLVGTFKDAGSAIAGRTSEASQQAQEHREHAAGFISQAGGHTRSMAQDAADAVKNALGAVSTDTMAPSGHH